MKCTCAICAGDLETRHPRYVLNFEQCANSTCLGRKVGPNSWQAPLPFPGAESVRRKTRASSAQYRFSCHLCLEETNGHALSYTCALCEACHHCRLTAAETRVRFTNGMVQLDTGATSEIRMCDGCGKDAHPVRFALPFFACRGCTARNSQRSLLSGLVARLPANKNLRGAASQHLFLSIPVGMLSGARRQVSEPPPQLHCSACGGHLASGAYDQMYIVNYTLCQACHSAPPAEVVYHFKGMFKRETAGHADLPHLQRYSAPVGQLGTGGFGNVYLVRGEMTQRMYAQKVVRMDSNAMRRRPRDFQEAITLQRCCHPNIVECFEAWYSADDASLYMVLEKAPQDLAKLLDVRRRKNPLEEVVVWYLLCHIAAGLQYLHNRDIIHRDLKPSNVLLCYGEDGGDLVAKLTDFGLARELSAMHQEWPPSQHQLSGSDAQCTAEVLTRRQGTPFYVAPEVLGAQPQDNGTVRYTRESDVWALGVLLWELAYTWGASPAPHPFRSYSTHCTQVDYQNIPEQPCTVPPRSSWLRELISDMLQPSRRVRPKIANVLLRAELGLADACKPVI